MSCNTVILTTTTSARFMQKLQLVMHVIKNLCTTHLLVMGGRTGTRPLDCLVPSSILDCSLRFLGSNICCSEGSALLSSPSNLSAFSAAEACNRKSYVFVTFFSSFCLACVWFFRIQISPLMSPMKI